VRTFQKGVNSFK